jgi:tetratricopeptide (TPR) repeat protein
MGPNIPARNESSPGESLRERYFVAAVLCITAVTYAGALRFGFVYDDDPQIRYNSFVKAWHFVPQYFVTSVWKQLYPTMPANYYRPMFFVWLRTNFAFFGLRPMGWHIAAVLLHVLVTWLVYLLVRKLTGRFTPAWLTALIFGVHPIHHEVVAWISGTTESLFAAAFLAAFLAYLNSLDGEETKWMAVSALLYGLALLCKETAIVLPAMVFACAWIAGSPQDPLDLSELGKRFRRALTPVGYYIPVAAVYLIARMRILSGLGHAMSSASVSSWMMTLPSILIFYVKHWFFPVGLAGFYDMYYQTQLSLRGVVLPAFVLVAMALALWILRKPLGVHDTAYALVWLVIPLLPALNSFVFSNGELVHDRYLYVPSIGASLLVALIIEKALAGEPAIFGQPSRVVAAALALTCVLGFCASWESSYWSDNFAMYARGHQVAPLSSTALNNLAGQLLVQKEYELAEPLLETGNQKFPEDGRFVYNLSRLRYINKQYEQSEKYAREAVRLDPGSGDSYVLLGQVLLKEGRAQEATDSIRRGVELNPDDETFHTSYGIVLKMNGDCAGANAQFDEALGLNPSDSVARQQKVACQASLLPGNSSTMKSSQP